MNINKKLCILVVSAASVFASVSVQAVPTQEAEKQQNAEKKAKEQEEILLRLLLLSKETAPNSTDEQYCPDYPYC
ncbi:MAG: hypothetical protein HRT35_19765 [Algicola sp.]|nr:hypothetical protein [Algicola sp.]